MNLYTNDYQDQSSNQLFALLQQRDRAALAFLYDKYAPALYGAILSKAANSDIASIILTKTFINIWQESAAASPVNQSIFSWMYAVAHRTIKVELSEASQQKSGVTVQAA